MSEKPESLKWWEKDWPLDKYNPETLPEHLRWKGDGPPPAYWYVGNTKVYRSYADYCDD